MSDSLFGAGFLLGTSMFLIQAWKNIQSKETSIKSMISYGVLACLNFNGILYFSRHHDFYATIGSVLQTVSLFINVGVIIWARSNKERQVIERNSDMAFIFDLDGTLFDTQTPVHASAEVEVLRELGIKMLPDEISQRFAGISTKQVFKELAPGHDPEKLLSRKWEIVKEKIDIPQHPIAGMYQLLSFLQEQGIPIALASASPRWYIEKLLEHSIEDKTSFRHPLKNFILKEYCVSAEEVSAGKPAPDVFLRAAEQLSMDPKKCVVIGDGHSDVLGGLRANMRVILFE